MKSPASLISETRSRPVKSVKFGAEGERVEGAQPPRRGGVEARGAGIGRREAPGRFMRFTGWPGAAMAAVAVAGAPDLQVSLPAGETRLADIGLYQVGYQSYGGEPVLMRPCWSGHFDEATGISYRKWEPVLGREALLLHSPWRVPPGRTWVDYFLVLPATRPITLAFGIAMGPDVALPGKSDGATFACLLRAGGKEQELMRAHHDLGEWRDFQFDLSAWAGRLVQLRLQVEPGPQNNASFDYSFFGDPRILAGPPTRRSQDRLREITRRRAYRATDRVSLDALANRSTQGVVPSNLLPARTGLRSQGAVWQFSYRGDDCRIRYEYRPQTGTLDDLTVQVDDAPPFQPAFGGGATFLAPSGNASSQSAESMRTIPARDGRLVKAVRDGDTLRVRWEYPRGGQTVPIDWAFQLMGKALVISARTEAPVVTSFSLGTPAAPLRKTVAVPYLLGEVAYLPVEQVFAGRYLDWTVSGASTVPQGESTYEPRTDGSRNPLAETGYIAVSPHVGEVLPNLPHPPSPYLAQLGPRVMLDIWGHQQGSYEGDARLLRTLKDHGVDHLALIQHDWQRFGYDVKLPDHLPANPRYGGDAGMIEFGRTARECGYLWSLHENYIDLYPDAPSYDPAARVLRADGSPSPAWYNPGTRVQSFGLKCNRALAYARATSPEAHRRYGTTAAYLDVHTCVPPWHQLDHEAGQPLAAIARAKLQHDTALFQFERDTHEGPLFGEGNHHFFWAGRADGVEAQVAGGEDHAVFLDFNLLKIHPQMVNHGMGYYERWYRRGYDIQWGVDAGSPKSLDKYRAQELAYGHAGFIGAALVGNVQAVLREHHLMHAVQRLTGAARVADIRYEADGRFVRASAALILGETGRAWITYDSGLELWVNLRSDPWTVRPASRTTSRRDALTLPAWGFLALGPETRVSTALHDGRVADYAECPEYIFADARTAFHWPYLRARKHIRPRLREFQSLGGKRVRATYEWSVQDTLEEDYRCFVHAVNPAESGTDRITFQQDHSLPKSTREWRPGETIIDGPYEFEVSEAYDRYDLVIGLFAGARVPLEGPSLGNDRVLIARLRLERQDGKVTRVSAEPVPADALPETTVPPEDFAAHTNPPGTFIDFGPVGTDGSVKVNREAGQLSVIPWPRDRPFRVSLDLPRLDPSARGRPVEVRALSAEHQVDLGPVTSTVAGGRLTFEVGMRGAGRYRVRW